ncbi:MAG: hypothetical protein QME94_12610 [Anaerolineae bacterium]|nr:hypothetical protein [Anaerolineae bacterium]
MNAEHMTPTTQRVADRPVRMAMAAAVSLGSFVRLFFVLDQDFPLNDGGLLYLMVRELQRSHYALPLSTSYNGAGIPFAYPPLGLYVAGLLADLSRWPLLGVFRFLPLVASVFALVAFCRLARDLLKGPAAGYAALAFALLPGSFTWQIMGGGITRSLGFLFALLAVHQAYLLYSRGGRRHAPSQITHCT